MLLTQAREIAEAELQQIQTTGVGPRDITAMLSVPSGWVFVTARRDTGGDHGSDTAGLAVREDGRVFHGLAQAHMSYTVAELEWLVPRGKGDFDRAWAAAALGYPAVAPLLPALLKCLQDMNWPIASIVGRFLSSIGAPLAPHLRTILSGDDNDWKYWIIGGVIGSNTELFELFKGDLIHLAKHPTADDRANESARGSRGGSHPMARAKPAQPGTGVVTAISVKRRGCCLICATTLPRSCARVVPPA
jgi:hypothetical protein